MANPCRSLPRGLTLESWLPCSQDTRVPRTPSQPDAHMVSVAGFIPWIRVE